MGVASLVLGILALIIAWVPCVGVYALGFSVLGLILGAVSMVKSKKTGKGKGLSIAGFVCNVVATALAVWWCIVMAEASSAIKEVDTEFRKAKSEVSKSLHDDLKEAADALERFR